MEPMPTAPPFTHRIRPSMCVSVDMATLGMLLASAKVRVCVTSVTWGPPIRDPLR